VHKIEHISPILNKQTMAEVREFTVSYLKPEIRTVSFKTSEHCAVIVTTPAGQFSSNTDIDVSGGAIALRYMCKLDHTIPITAQTTWDEIAQELLEPEDMLRYGLAQWFRRGYELIVRDEYTFLREGLKTASDVLYYRVWDIRDEWSHRAVWIMRNFECFKNTDELQDPAMLIETGYIHRTTVDIGACLVLMQCSDELITAINDCPQFESHALVQGFYAHLSRINSALALEFATLTAHVS
jgi:hypothetical protein